MDSDPIIVRSQKPDDMTAIVTDISAEIQYKFIFMTLISFLLISSDTFISSALGRFDSAVVGGSPTSYGTCLQGIFLVLIMMIIDGSIKQKVI